MIAAESDASLLPNEDGAMLSGIGARID